MAPLEPTADSLSDALDDRVDPELLELPSPPQGRRLLTLTVMALAVAVALALAFGIRHDVAYFFSASSARDLGDATELDLASVRPNQHVTVHGTAMVSRAAHYRRGLTGTRYVVFPLAGQRAVYVQVPEGPDAFARTEFTGRLVTFSQLGAGFRSVERYLDDALELPVSGESFLLVADESPRDNVWALFVLLLCLAVIILDVWLFLRLFRQSAG